MEEENDIYYVDGRNADIRSVMGWPRPTSTPQRVGARPVTSTRTVYVNPAGGIRGPVTAYGQPYVQPNMIYPQGAAFGAGLGVGSLFGNLTTGQVIDMVAQIFAVLQPLPTAPVATADAPTDIGNSILYQTALAEYAKRDEQVRTIGNLVAKLVG
jgi:hypothetical protein